MNIVADRANYIFLPILLGMSAALGTVFFFLKRGDRTITMPSFIIYSVVTFLAFGGVGLTVFFDIAESFYLFVANQVIFLLLGILHVWAMFSLLKWTSKESFWHEMVFTLFEAILGMAAYTFVFDRFKPEEYPVLFSTAVIAFVIPFFVLKTFDFMLAIPELEYKKYYLPVGKTIEIPEELDMEKAISIKFLVQISHDKPYDEIKANVPSVRQVFGEYFPVAVADHNDKHPGHRIDGYDKTRKPQGWLFYFPPQRWWQSKKFIDSDLTVAENGISDYSVIVAERV